MPKISVESSRALKLACGDKDDLYEHVQQEIIDEWRWGNVYELIVRNKKDGTLWGFTYQEQSGDRYHNSLENEPMTEFYQLEARKVVKWEYYPVP